MAALLAVAALLIWIGAALIGGIGGWMRNASDGAGAPDPMFEQTEPPVTRPPELAESAGTPPPRDEDPSRHWVYKTLTPVDTVEPSV